MKSLFPISLLLFVLALFGCSKEYTITGNIDGAIDGDSVILGYSVDGVEFTVTDRTVIENGQFHFSGNTDGCKIYYIGYEQSIEPTYLLFFLEEGNININMSGEESTVSGTPSNDLNSEIEGHIARYVNAMLGADFQLEMDTELSDSAKAQLNLTICEARRDAMQYIRGVIEDNNKSIVSLYLLVQYSDLFSIEELEQLSGEIPSENIDRNNNCLYDILIETINERKVLESQQQETGYEW